MNHKRLSSAAFVMLLCTSLCSPGLNAQDVAKTETTQNPSAMVKTASSSSEQLTAAEKKLLGKHMFSLQWISWEQFGSAVVTRGKQGLEIEARQELNGDFITLKGTIEIIDEKAFNFTGEVVKYWRMQQMENPCDPVTDYIDVFF